MATRLVHLVVDAADPERLARFWSAALGWEMAAEDDGEWDVWPAGYRYPDPVALPLVFVPVPERQDRKEPRPSRPGDHLTRAPGGRGGAAARAWRDARPTSARATCPG